MADPDDRLLLNLSFRIKKARLLKRETIDEAEDALKLKDNTLGRIESGTQNYKLKTVYPILRYYQIALPEVSMDIEVPTHEDWKRLKIMQKELNRYKRSKDKQPPSTGVQLRFDF